MSAPTEKPLWIDPCGGSTAPTAPHHDVDITSLSSTPDQELLSHIIITAESALRDAKRFSEPYVYHTFKQNFSKHHESWKHIRYHWLPSKEDIPKEFGENTPKDHFKPDELDASLLRSYEYLQRIAVGLEQVHLDKDRLKEAYKDDFQNIMYKLRMVLCEVQTALIERNPMLTITDMERSIMDETFRAMDDHSSRHLRDWFIYRDFMNCLEYLIDLCKFFKEQVIEG